MAVKGMTRVDPKRGPVRACATCDELRAALRQFADPSNWHEAPGLQQWMGKRDARSFAKSALNGWSINGCGKMTEQDWQLVPREPTPDMRIAGGIAWSDAMPTAATYVDAADACYKAMLAVAPTREDMPAAGTASRTTSPGPGANDENEPS